MASRSDDATESASDILSNVLNAVEDETIRAYRAKCIAPALRIAARGHFSVRNAHQWVDLEKFLDFVSKQAQQPEPQTPKHSRPLPDSSSPNIQAYTPFPSHSDVADRPTKCRCSSLDNSPFPSSPSPLFAHLSVFNTNPQPPPAAQPTVTTPEQPDIMNTKKRGRKVTKADKQEAAGRIRVTRKLWVDGTINVSGPMENWPVPKDGGKFVHGQYYKKCAGKVGLVIQLHSPHLLLFSVVLIANGGTMLMDGSAPQIQGLGDVLLLENDPAISGIDAMTAEEIVQWLVRTCNWHFKHNLDPLSQVLPKEDMDRIRGFQHLQFQEQMDDFIKWASTHPEKKLRDWIANKVVHPWYIPSLCKHFSKIPGFDWDLSPAGNNLNETSHPATNRATGIALPLVEAIERARPYDIQVLTDLQKLEETCVQRNPHNTLRHRFSSNGHRHNSRSLKYDEAHEKREKLAGIDKRLAKVEEDRRRLETQSKALRAERKLASGSKRTHTKVTPSRRPTLPAFGERIVADPAKENENPFLVVASTSALTLDPELEPPPPTLSYFPSSVTPSPFYSSGSGSGFPSSTCPPSFWNPSYSPFSNTAGLAAQDFFWHRYQ
ncbi:hypothetical protein M422DRAFT_267645 [Sphaerobolus stellatus SS14]|uniref:Uncharacterized protein n=1 Tax=Sphaerobolus stellatus (strain SS14) TaxID=990650 RepID=A0A0C9V068_SPHS4|nr:hypothetical protein M422DRAFT_267645 [Sphaerobolus stellatus SS14]